MKSWWCDLGNVAILTCVTIALYAQVGSFDYVNWDDPDYTTKAELVQAGFSATTLQKSITGYYCSNWHPLTWWSLMLDRQWFGDSPAAYHLVNVAWHVLATVLAYAGFVAMTGSRWPSFLVAWLFAVHPLHVESVAWIAERKDVLCGAFWFASLWAYAEYCRRGSWQRYGLTLLLLLLSHLAKPMAVTLPCVFVLLDIWPLRRKSQAHLDDANAANPFFSKFSWPGIVAEKVPFFAVSALTAFMTFQAQKTGGAMADTESFSLSARVINSVASYGKYLQQTVWPSHLACFYPLPPESGRETVVAATAAALLVISIWALVLYRRQPNLLIGWLWYLGSLVPVIGLVQVGAQAHADRYTYLPLVGVFVMAAWSVEAITRARWRAVARVGLLAAGGVLAIVAHQQIGVWRNSETLYRHALAVTTDNLVATMNLGQHYQQRAQQAPDAATHRDLLNAALEHQIEAVRIAPGNGIAHANLASIFLEHGRLEEAMAAADAALRLGFERGKIVGLQALALARSGRLQQSLPLFVEAVQLNPRDPVLAFNWSIALLKTGQKHQARQVLQQIVDDYPDFAPARNRLQDLR
ncbi:MAG: tetratricopeptide repeat protein [Planctomycetaceae bacterium]|nr:tetratricopeptide repeat protein [Planctomycetaceae bacterium]